MLEEVAVPLPRSVEGLADAPASAGKVETVRVHSRELPTAEVTGSDSLSGDNSTALLETNHAVNNMELSTYYTNLGCCYISCVCWIFFQEPGVPIPEYLSLPWKQVQCC